MTHNSKTTNALSIATPQDGATQRHVDSDPAAANQFSSEDSALALLQHADLHPDVIEKLSKSSISTKCRKVKPAIVRHPKSKRHVSLSLIRKLFTFDLMQVALSPAVAGDLKVAAEEVLIHRLETISAGEKLSLARRASGRVASALLLDRDPRIITAALENPRLTEVLVAKAVLCNEASPTLVRAVCTHAKWSLRRELRIALLRNEHTPAQFAIEFAKSLPNEVVKEVLQKSRLLKNVKAHLVRIGQ